MGDDQSAPGSKIGYSKAPAIPRAEIVGVVPKSKLAPISAPLSAFVPQTFSDPFCLLPPICLEKTNNLKDLFATLEYDGSFDNYLEPIRRTILTKPPILYKDI